MGVYVYSLRKKKVPFYIDGKKHEANLFDYAYKVDYGWRTSKAYDFVVRNTDRLSKEAYSAYSGGYVIVGNHDGAAIYNNVVCGHWVDCGDFPGDYLGQVEKVGHRLNLNLALDLAV